MRTIIILFVIQCFIYPQRNLDQKVFIDENRNIYVKKHSEIIFDSKSSLWKIVENKIISLGYDKKSIWLKQFDLNNYQNDSIKILNPFKTKETTYEDKYNLILDFQLNEQTLYLSINSIDYGIYSIELNKINNKTKVYNSKKIITRFYYSDSLCIFLNEDQSLDIFNSETDSIISTFYNISDIKYLGDVLIMNTEETTSAFNLKSSEFRKLNHKVEFDKNILCFSNNKFYGYIQYFGSNSIIGIQPIIINTGTLDEILIPQVFKLNKDAFGLDMFCYSVNLEGDIYFYLKFFYKDSDSNLGYVYSYQRFALHKVSDMDYDIKTEEIYYPFKFYIRLI